MLIFEDFFDDIDIEVQDDKVDVSSDDVIKFVPMD